MPADLKIQLMLRDSADTGYTDSIAFIESVILLPQRQLNNSAATEPPVFTPNPRYEPGDWLVPVLLVILIVAGLTTRYYGSKTFASIREFFTGASSDFTDGDFILNQGSGRFLTAIAAAGVGLFSFLGVDYYLQPEFNDFANFGLFLLLTIVAVLLAFLKLLLYEVLAALFDLKSVSGDFLNYYFGFLISAGILLLPFSVFSAYSGILNFEHAFAAGCIITAALFVMQLFKTFYRYTFHYRFSPGYNILYLCSLEILPWLLLILKLME